MTTYIVNNSQETVNIRAERTPGEVAVSGWRAEGGGSVSPDTPAALYPKTNSKRPDTINRAELCGTKAIFTECEGGEHAFAKRLMCNLEWCPRCGEDGSEAHQRRIARCMATERIIGGVKQLWPKYNQIGHLGYLVIEFPDRYRKRIGWTYSKRGLSRVTDRIFEVMAGKHGRKGRVGGYFKRGYGRWHWFGDQMVGKYNPHFNMLVDGAYIEPESLENIKADLRKALLCPDLIVHYDYFDTPGQIYQKLKYVTRATFRQWEWDTHMAQELFNFPNGRWWGKWNDEAAWQLTPEIEAEADAIAEMEKLGSGICPVCGCRLKKWSRAIDSAYLTIWGAEEIGHTGYYRIPKREWDSSGDMSPGEMYARLMELEQLEKAKRERLAEYLANGVPENIDRELVDGVEEWIKSFKRADRKARKGI